MNKSKAKVKVTLLAGSNIGWDFGLDGAQSDRNGPPVEFWEQDRKSYPGNLWTHQRGSNAMVADKFTISLLLAQEGR